MSEQTPKSTDAKTKIVKTLEGFAQEEKAKPTITNLRDRLLMKGAEVFQTPIPTPDELAAEKPFGAKVENDEITTYKSRAQAIAAVETAFANTDEDIRVEDADILTKDTPVEHIVISSGQPPYSIRDINEEAREGFAQASPPILDRDARIQALAEQFRKADEQQQPPSVA